MLESFGQRHSSWPGRFLDASCELRTPTQLMTSRLINSSDTGIVGTIPLSPQTALTESYRRPILKDLEAESRLVVK
jgi:hypothetical protein